MAMVFQPANVPPVLASVPGPSTETVANELYGLAVSTGAVPLVAPLAAYVTGRVPTC